VGGGPGNLDFAKFADQVPAKPPGSMSAALTFSEIAAREKAKIINLIFMADIIIQMKSVSIPKVVDPKVKDRFAKNLQSRRTGNS
jgi:hypothetical protein